jgi:hypothetical protein
MINAQASCTTTEDEGPTTTGRSSSAATRPPREDQPSVALDLSMDPDRKIAYFQGFLMARGGLEPPTPRFSVECSTS